MHGDFSLDPLAYRDRVSRVLSQQGRVQLDSDANEQTESLLRFLRGLAFDLIGAHGGVDGAFEVNIPDTTKPGVLIRWGTYYVDGIRCVNFPTNVDPWEISDASARVGDGVTYAEQPHYFPPNKGDWTKGETNDVLFYLDVFERHVSAEEDESLREVALLGPDTASRAVIVWQVRTMPAEKFLKLLTTLGGANLPATWDAPYVALNRLLRSNVRMRAKAVETETTDPCTIAPDARYRGFENRLFRVEIHDTGEAGSEPTFKWSSNNASVVYPVRSVAGKIVHLDSLGRDERTKIQINDWVEVVDDKILLMAKANRLVQVVDIHPHAMTVTLSDEPEDNAGNEEGLHPILRRWDSAPVPLQPEASGYTELADGVEVQFLLSSKDGTSYRTGDYWLIPTRTAIADVQWPKDNGDPRAVPPHGIQHHYAPLALAIPQTRTIRHHYRRHFAPIATA